MTINMAINMAINMTINMTINNDMSININNNIRMNMTTCITTDINVSDPPHAYLEGVLGGKGRVLLHLQRFVVCVVELMHEPTLRSAAGHRHPQRMAAMVKTG